LYGTSETDTWVWSGVLGPYREVQLSALNRVQKRSAKFANNINESGWETLAQQRLIARIPSPFQGIYRETGFERDRQYNSTTILSE
jgi:hypothetical protein